MVERDVVGEILAQVTDVFPFYGAVDDDAILIALVGDHQVVENAAVFIEQQRVAHPAGFQRRNIAGDERFERFGDAVARE